MVKKIDGNKPIGSQPTDAVEPTKAVKTTRSGTVNQVASAERQVGSRKVRRQTRPITSAEREHLMQLISEEASKIFGPNGLPESERNTVEGAVKMAIDASIVDEEDEKPASQ